MTKSGSRLISAAQEILRKSEIATAARTLLEAEKAGEIAMDAHMRDGLRRLADGC